MHPALWFENEAQVTYSLLFTRCRILDLLMAFVILDGLVGEKPDLAICLFYLWQNSDSNYP